MHDANKQNFKCPNYISVYGKLLCDEMTLRTNNGEANLWIQRGNVVVRKRECSV